MFSPIIWLWFSGWWKKRNNIEEIIKNNVDNWAKEFFTWYNPEYWYTKFWFEVSPNGRFSEHEQVIDYESLEMIIGEVHKHGKEIMWNLNAWYYTSEVETEIKQIIEDFLNVGIDGFICWSLWILEYLDSISEDRFDKWYIINWRKIKINISTILAVYNKDAITFLLEEYPISKVILSREISLEEIDDILLSFPDLAFEVFGEWDFCRYNNGLCFAEHKYTDRDICTVVVNDLIVKKTINYDFRRILQKEDISNNEKIEKFDNEYLDEFEQLSELFEEYIEWETAIEEHIDTLVYTIQHKYILYYDPLEPINSKNNKNIKLVLKWMKLKAKNFKLSKEDSEFLIYLTNEIKLGLQMNLNNIKNIQWWKFGVLAQNKDTFYNRSDLLNLYAYVFFDKFENIDTVKFPTRGRNYLPKLEIIRKILDNPSILENEITLDNIYIRSHYDLKYLFDGDKKWFYKIRKQIHNKLLK